MYFRLDINFIVKPQKRKAMEKIILAGIIVWLSFMLTDGFPPPTPVKKPDKQKIEISKQTLDRPDALKHKWVRTTYD